MKITPLYDDIGEVKRALINRKLLVPSPKSTTQPSFVVDVPKKCNSDAFYEYHQQQGYIINYYVTLLNKIQDLMDQKKVYF